MVIYEKHCICNISSKKGLVQWTSPSLFLVNTKIILSYNFWAPSNWKILYSWIWCSWTLTIWRVHFVFCFYKTGPNRNIYWYNNFHRPNLPSHPPPESQDGILEICSLNRLDGDTSLAFTIQVKIIYK